MKNSISISLTDQELANLKKLARQAQTSRTGVIREALRGYEKRQAWESIRVWGTHVALELGITSYDDVDRIAGK